MVWISDLRRFTRMSDEFAPPVMLGILNDHFERVVGAIGVSGASADEDEHCAVMGAKAVGLVTEPTESPLL